MLLRKKNPSLRVIVVERAEAFDRKVGEATTEISGAFLTRRLGMMPHLNQFHLYKQGLRFWFAPPEGGDLGSCGEVGARYQVKLPSYQVDRAVLDEELLRMAAREGTELRRPARITRLKLPEEGSAESLTELTIRSGDSEETLRTRWLIDASGKAAVVGRSLGLVRKLEEHRTNAMWARFRDVRDWDSQELLERFPQLQENAVCSRTAATNHLTGYGWWCWIIPLRGGDFSLGLVYDERLFSPPEGGTIGERLLRHVRNHAAGREIFADAQPVEGDAKAYSHLPYYCERIAGPGWQIVGDAAGFMDPLYSQGLDYGAWTVTAAVERILAAESGKPDCPEAFNHAFRQSYNAWFRGLYLDKYRYLGDAELMTSAYLMDIGLFFFGPVRTVVEDIDEGFGKLPFTGPVDRQVAKLMALYNRRLAHLAERRRHRGTYGARNSDTRMYIQGFGPDVNVCKLILRGALGWARAEWQELVAGRPGQPAPIQKPVTQPHTV